MDVFQQPANGRKPGYSPGTAVGATGEGRYDAFWGGVLGMLVGAGIFSKIYTSIRGNLLTRGDFGKITTPRVTGMNHWIIIALSGRS